MNTVGKKGKLGEQIRCVVSVSMLTEGWDANTVTHILGVRAFGTQLLCEQVVGRGLRRQSYELNSEGQFDVEYADILGIPFDFAAKPVIAPPAKPRETIRVHAVKPERDALEIIFPRVEGYRVELPDERLDARFGPDSVLELTPDLVGPSITTTQGIVGAGVDLTLGHLGDMRQSTVLYQLTAHLLYKKYRDPGEEPKMHLFGQLKRIARAWLEGGYLKCSGGTYPAQLMYNEISDMAAERIKAAITETLAGERPVKAILDAYNPTGSTAFVNFTTSKALRFQTHPQRSHVNWVVCDSDWEAELCRVAEAHPKVRAYVKNQGLGLEVPYLVGSKPHKYFPDFIVQVDDGQPEPLNLIVEVKGYRGENAKDKANTMRAYWVPGVNNLKKFGRWAFAEFTAVYEIEAEFGKLIEGLCAASTASVTA
jgi:type III restriction enzyme